MNTMTISRAAALILGVVGMLAMADVARAADACLAGASATSDAAEVSLLRGAIDAVCPCATYDGSDGFGRKDFKGCVAGQIKLAVEAGDLRKPCKGRLKKLYKDSVCGNDASVAPCVERLASGKTRCRISSAETCTKKSGDYCSEHVSCVDAADTTGDLQVNADDSGICIVATTTTLPEDTTTTTLPEDTTTTSTTSTTSTTLDILCGTDSPDVNVIVNPDTDPVIVPESTMCPMQTFGQGGCLLPTSMDGSEYNHLSGHPSTDGRVCSQDDAALSYRWQIYFPPTLRSRLVVGPAVATQDSMVLEIPPSSLPSLEDTDAGSDIFWRVELTVTPLPLEGEEITPAPSKLYFRFRYQQTEMTLECYNAAKDPTCDLACRQEVCPCDSNPAICEW